MRKTRQSIFLEWVILKADWGATHAVLRLLTKYIPVHVSCLPGVHLQELLMVGEAMPLLPVMDEVMNEMLVFGQRESYKWYCDTLTLFAYFVEHGIEPSREWLVREVLQIYVDGLLYSHYAPSSFTYSVLMVNFHMEFDNRIYSVHKTFYAMVRATAVHVQQSIAQVQSG